MKCSSASASLPAGAFVFSFGMMVISMASSASSGRGGKRRAQTAGGGLSPELAASAPLPPMGVSADRRAVPRTTTAVAAGALQSRIKRTWAMESSREWVSVKSDFVAPSAVKRASAPAWNCSCGGPWWRTTSMPCQ